MKHKHLMTFVSIVAVTWVSGTNLLFYCLPHLVNSYFKRTIVHHIPFNTLYTEPQAFFADPVHTPPPLGPNLMTTGVNRDTLLTGGWLDLSKGPQVLHVPDFSGRYYSLQFTDPFDVDFAYVGTRTTGTKADDYLITGPDWKGEVPTGMARISSPSDSVLVIGRVLVYRDSDLPTAHDLAKQIQIVPTRQR